MAKELKDSNANGQVKHVGKDAAKQKQTENNASTKEKSKENGVDSKYAKANSVLEKQFQPRESTLNVMFKENLHIRSLHHLAVSSVIVMLFDAVLRGGSLRLISPAFRGIYIASLAWLSMFAITLTIYPIFQLWSKIRRFNSIWVLAIAIFYANFLWWPAKLVISMDGVFGIGTRSILVFEQIRMLMKIHSFIRRNSLEILGKKVKTGSTTFGQYIYFLFAPTLLYRHRYPRNEGPVKWLSVLRYITELMGCIFVFAYTVERFLIPIFSEYGYNTDPKNIWRLFSGTILPGSVFLINGHYLLLHAWMNCWAEILRFADRNFYSDWWCSSSFSAYYRRWNIVVHDWLYEYIYAEILRFKNVPKGVAAMCVFGISAIVHEYVLTLILAMFFPLMLVQFGMFGASLTFLRVTHYSPNVGNIFVWLCLTSGSGICLALYTTEFYARQNCILPSTNSEFLDYITPRSFFC